MKRVFYYMAFVLWSVVLMQGCNYDLPVTGPQQTEITGEVGTRWGDFPWEGTQLLKLTGAYDGNSSVSLSWEPVTSVAWAEWLYNSGNKGYTIQKKSPSGVFSFVAQNIFSTSYTVTGVTPGEGYFVYAGKQQYPVGGLWFLPESSVPSNIYTVPGVQPSPVTLRWAIGRNDDLTLTWSFKSGADTNWDTFQVWREEIDGTHTLHATVMWMSCYILNAPKGNYYIKCGRTVGNGVEYSEASNYYYHGTLNVDLLQGRI